MCHMRSSLSLLAHAPLAAPWLAMCPCAHLAVASIGSKERCSSGPMKSVVLGAAAASFGASALPPGLRRGAVAYIKRSPGSLPEPRLLLQRRLGLGVAGTSFAVNILF